MDDSIKNILSLQIKDGYKSYYGGMSDLNAVFMVADTILRKSGYRIPSEEEIDECIRLVFNREPYYRDSVLTIINWYCEPVITEEGDTLTIETHDEPNDLSLLYINRKLGFATYAYYLPELLDYATLFPDLLDLEKEVQMFEDEFGEVHENLRWKDEKAELVEIRKYNSQFIVHLNQYLFHQNRASLGWLENNSPEFTRSFVTTFGYTKDLKLLKWVLDNNAFYCDYMDRKDNIDIFTKILTNRRCDGTLVFNHDVLEYIEKNLSENYIDQITSYILTTSSSYKETTILTREFSFSERAELYARLLYWGEYIVRNHDEPYKHYVYNFMVTFCEDNKNFEEYTKEFKSKNYYNLPHFEEYWNIARDKFYNPEIPQRSPFIPEDEG